MNETSTETMNMYLNNKDGIQTNNNKFRVGPKGMNLFTKSGFVF